MTYILTMLYVDKKVNIKILIGVIIAFITANILIGNIFEKIIYRFTGGTEFELENVFQHTEGETRIIKWVNALIVIKQNLFFWSITGGSFIQSGGIKSAVKAYYFMVVIAMIVLLDRVNGVVK